MSFIFFNLNFKVSFTYEMLEIFKWKQSYFDSSLKMSWLRSLKSYVNICLSVNRDCSFISLATQTQLITQKLY